MGRLGRVLLVLVVLAAAVVAGLSVFVRFYLTEDRLKAMIIPQAEQALGRTVEIGGIDVSLFRGITVRDFSVKEADGKAEFADVKEFILRYDFWPLLHRQIVVSEIGIADPTVQIVRDEAGRFNFETLAVLAPADKEEKALSAESRQGVPPAALPLALTVSKVSVERARLTVSDAIGEIPKTEAQADLQLGLSMGLDLASIRYQGDLRFVADSVYGEIKPHLLGKTDFDQDRLRYTVDIDVDKQAVRLAGEVKDYVKTPQIRLDVTSELLDLDRLMAMTAGLPKATKAKRPPETKAPEKTPGAPGDALPPGLVAQGEVNIKRAPYKGLKVQNFHLTYALKNGILSIKDLTARTAGGALSGKASLDLMRPGLAYQGDLSAESLQIEEIIAALAPKAKGGASGIMGAAFSFSGKGIEWPEMRHALSLDGEYGVKDGLIRQVPITEAIAGILGLNELRTLSFKDLSGNVHILKGQAAIKAAMKDGDVRAESQGTVGLDGRLDLPLMLHFSPALSEKLQKRTSLTKYLADEEGEMAVRLRLSGTVTKPRPSLDTAAVREQAEKALGRKAVEELDKAISGKKGEKGAEKPSKPSPAEDLLKGLLGR